MKTFKLICLLLVCIWPVFKTGLSIGEDLAKKERKSISLVAGATVLFIELMVMYYAGVFTLFNDHE